MKKRIKALTLVLFSICCMGLTMLPVTASAVEVINPACKNADPKNLPAICQPGSDSHVGNSNPLFGPGSALDLIIQVLSAVVGFGAVLMIIVSGIRMATSGGDAQSLKSARASLTHALVALLIAALAETIVGFVLGKL